MVTEPAESEKVQPMSETLQFVVVKRNAPAAMLFESLAPQRQTEVCRTSDPAKFLSLKLYLYTLPFLQLRSSKTVRQL
jgi:hypothetical protein